MASATVGAIPGDKSRPSIFAWMVDGAAESRVVVFTLAETLVDETRSWSAVAGAASFAALTLFGALGVVI